MTRPCRTACSKRFNPRPASLRGASSGNLVTNGRMAGFNPRPASLRGASFQRSMRIDPDYVSILAPHRCGARHGLQVRVVGNQKFQSSPRIAAGRVLTCAGGPSSSSRFQSSPRIAAGRVASQCRRDRRTDGFNPRPASLRGASNRDQASFARFLVSILAPHRCGARHDEALPYRLFKAFQSSPRIAAGRVPFSFSTSATCRSFQSSPRIAAGRVEMSAYPTYPIQAVSILAPHRCGARRFRRFVGAHAAAFQSSPRIAAGRVVTRSGSVMTLYRFNPRPASLRGASVFVSRRTGHSYVSILAPHRCGARRSSRGSSPRHWYVSILAPHRCGARRFKRNRRKSQEFRPALRGPALEPAPVIPSVSQLTCVGLKNQYVEDRATLPANLPSLQVRA